MVDQGLNSYRDPGEQTSNGTKRETKRCPETVDMFAPIDAVRE